jgi:hypothetical protein
VGEAINPTFTAAATTTTTTTTTTPPSPSPPTPPPPTPAAAAAAATWKSGKCTAVQVPRLVARSDCDVTTMR